MGLDMPAVAHHAWWSKAERGRRPTSDAISTKVISRIRREDPARCRFSGSYLLTRHPLLLVGSMPITVRLGQQLKSRWDARVRRGDGPGLVPVPSWAT